MKNCKYEIILDLCINSMNRVYKILLLGDQIVSHSAAKYKKRQQ
jgi:hypothetical protein